MEVEIEKKKKQKDVSSKSSHSSNGISGGREKMQSRKGGERQKIKAEKTVEKIKVGFVKQRAQDLTTHAKTVMAKDKEIQVLKDRCKRLGHSSTKEKTVQKSKIKDQLEFEKIIAQQTKERMHLERHLALATESLQKTAEINVTKYLALEETNQALRQRLLDLDRYLNERESVELEFEKKKGECYEIQKQLQLKSELCLDLKNQLNQALNKNTELVVQNSDLQTQTHNFGELKDECSSLREKLDKAKGEYSKAEDQVGDLSSKLATLEAVVRNLREAAEKRKELERDHAEALAQLRTRQEDAKLPRKPGEKERFKSGETIESLESKVRELQKKCELQNVCHEELMLEMTSLRRQQAKQSWSSSQQSSLTDGITSPESNISSPENAATKSLSNGDSGMVSNFNNDPPHPISFQASLSMDSYNNSNTGFGTVLESTSKEIDRILARIEQDNKVLAELDRPRSALGFSMITDCPDTMSPFYNGRYRSQDDHSINASATYGLKPSRSMNELDSLQAMSERCSNRRPHAYLNNRGRPHAKYCYVNPELDQLMAKLEQDNKILAELDKTRASIGLMNPISSQYSSTVPSATTALGNSYIGNSLKQSDHFFDSNRNLTDHLSRSGTNLKFDGTGLIDDTCEFIEIPGKGQVQVFVAKYTYDPLIHSPNENPEAELNVSAGEYVIVYGEMDEDGFYDGELLDGKKGLVPSNFVTKLIGEDLYDFQSQVLYGSTKDSDDSGASFSQELDFLDDYQLPLEDYKRMNDYIDLEDIEEVDEDNLSELEGGDTHVPPPNPPQRLTLERQLNKSILIAWLPAEGSSESIESYLIYVDGVLKNTVKSKERTRALVEGVDSSRPHRISVRSVGSNGKQSKDAACTISIGKDSPLAPAYVTATNITSTSAIISWLPSNSNFQHVICVNSVEVRIVKPGIFRHTITGLAPDTEYRVSVRAKAGKSTPSKSAFNDEKNRRKMERLTAYVDFKTLPKGLPDPPIDVQCESGPQDGTLLVTWLPVTISATGGTSNGCPVTGYTVFIDGKRMSDVGSPTSDHTLLDISSLDQSQVKSLTVRTKSGESLSTDSISCKIPSGGKSRKGYKEDFAEDSSDRDELSDIAEEPEEDLSDTTQTKSAEKKEAKKQTNGVKENPPPAQKKTTKETGTSPAKEVKHRPNKESSSTKHDEDYENVSGGRVRGPVANPHPPRSGVSHPSDRERHHHHQQNAPTQQQRDGRGYSESRRSQGSNMGPQPAAKMSNSGGYHRDMDARQEEDYRKRGYRKEPDYRKDPGHRRNNPQPVRDQSRLFVALFDYDPQTMSPNPDGADEELPFHEGQIIKIHGDKDNDGFYRGEANGRIGYVPCNMVSEVQVDDDEVAHQLMRDQHPHQNHRQAAGPRGRGNPQRSNYQNDRWHGHGVRKMVALYDYDPQELSPNVDAEVVELSFSTGDIIYVHGDMDEDGFFMGEIGGVRGLVPSNFLTEVPADYRDGNAQRNELGVGKVSHHHVRKDGNWDGHQGRGPPPPPTTSTAAPGTTYAQLPSDHRQHHANPRPFPNERPQLPPDGRGQPYPNERGPPPPRDRNYHPNDREHYSHGERGPYPNDRPPGGGSRNQFQGESRGQFPPEQGQYGGERPNQYSQGERGPYPPGGGRGPGYNDRAQYTAGREQYTSQGPGSNHFQRGSNNIPQSTTNQQYSGGTEPAAPRMPYGQPQKVGGAPAKW